MSKLEALISILGDINLRRADRTIDGRLLYRIANGFWIDRLITQHRFEQIASSPEALRIARWHRANNFPQITGGQP